MRWITQIETINDEKGLLCLLMCHMVCKNLIIYSNGTQTVKMWI